MHVRLKFWNVKKVGKNKVILIIGRRGTGKTTMMENILFELRHRFDIVYSMTPNHEPNNMFLSHLPDTCVYGPEVDTEEYTKRVDNIISVFEEMKEYSKQTGKRQRNALICWDDCMFDKKLMKTKEMRRLMMNARNSNISFMNSTQYLMDMPSGMREQCDYVVVLKENSKHNKEKLWKYFFGMFPTCRSFCKVFDAATEDWGALVLDNTRPEHDFEKSLYFYRSKYFVDKENPENSRPIPAFRMGNLYFHKLSKQYEKVKENVFAAFCGEDKTKTSDENIEKVIRCDKDGNPIKKKKKTTRKQR